MILFGELRDRQHTPELREKLLAKSSGHKNRVVKKVRRKSPKELLLFMLHESSDREVS